MKVEISLSDKIDEPIVVIHANRMNEEVYRKSNYSTSISKSLNNILRATLTLII